MNTASELRMAIRVAAGNAIIRTATQIAQRLPECFEKHQTEQPVTENGKPQKKKVS